MAMSAPSRASWRAMALPMPRLPPVRSRAYRSVRGPWCLPWVFWSARRAGSGARASAPRAYSAVAGVSTREHSRAFAAVAPDAWVRHSAVLVSFRRLAAWSGTSWRRHQPKQSRPAHFRGPACDMIAAMLVTLTWPAAAVAQVPATTAQAGPFSLSAEALLCGSSTVPRRCPSSPTASWEPGLRDLLGGKDLDRVPSRLPHHGSLRGETAGRRGGSSSISCRGSRTRSVSSSGQIGSTDLIVPYFDGSRPTREWYRVSFAPLYAAPPRKS